MKKVAVIQLLMLIQLCLHAQNDTLPAVRRLLDLSLEELMDIKVVSASGYLQTTAEAPSTITVITARQIEERGYQQLEDALRDVPGIDMIHINGYAPTLFYFRGMYGAENTRALLMIDGVVENNILGSNDLAGPAYSLQNVERIEIVWGPLSALYGANAFGGVINMITKKGADINGLHVKAGFGSFNTRFVEVNTGLRKGSWEFSAAATLFNSDGPRFENRDPNYTGSYFHDVNSFQGTVSFYGKRSKTTFNYRSFKTPMGWGTYSNSPTVYLRLPPQGNQNAGIIGVIQREFRGEQSGLDLSNLHTMYLQNDFSISDKLALQTRVTYRETGIGDQSYIYVTTDGRKLIRVPIATFSNRVIGDAGITYKIDQHQNLSAGLQYIQDNVEAGSRGVTFDINTIYLVDGRDTVVNLNSTFLPRKFDVRTTYGGYLQYQVNTTLLNKTSFTAGIRYDHNSYFGGATSPRLTIVNQPTDKLTFKLQYGRAFRAPTNLEIHSTPANANYQLTYETINSYEFNVILTALKKVRLQLNLYRNELDHIIVLANLSNPLTPNKNPG
ncbi:MAG TPA: TonB-dependent receptor, partial [Chitinophagaceae bacterium]